MKGHPAKFIKISLLLLALGIFAAPTKAQDDEDWPPMRYLRNDYREVAAVAHVNVTRAEIASRIGGYENWRLRGTIIEPVKGRLKKGGEIEFLHGAEAGFKTEMFLGEKIVFLLHDYDREKRRRVYTVLENSTLKHDEKIMRKLRTIKRAASRKKPPKRT